VIQNKKMYINNLKLINENFFKNNTVKNFYGIGIRSETMISCKSKPSMPTETLQVEEN